MPSDKGSWREPVLDQRVDVLQAVIARLNEILLDSFIQWATACNTPDGGDEGETGERFPFFGKVVINELFASSLKTIGTLLERHQGWIADEDCGIGVVEHRIEVSGHGNEGYFGVAPLVEKNARVRQCRAARRVRGDAVQILEWLICAPHQQQ